MTETEATRVNRIQWFAQVKGRKKKQVIEGASYLEGSFDHF